MPELHVSKSDHFLFRIPIQTWPFRMGRSDQNDLSLPDEEISRLHAEILHEDGRYQLKNLGSSGTLLSGRKVDTAELVDGATFSIGVWEFRFQSTGEADRQFLRDRETCITRINNDPPTRILQFKPGEEKFRTLNAVLTVTGRDGSAKRIPFKRGSLVVGAKNDCDVVIADDTVSGRHCEFVKKGNHLILRDLGSTNGTWLKGAKISEVPLTDSAEIKIGTTRLCLSWDEGEEVLKAVGEDRLLTLVGGSEPMRRLYAKIQRVAPTDLTVLVQGETGSGKELVARAIHDLSPRVSKPFVALNCGAISQNLIESELFGHERGAFTGATGRHLGAFEQAQGGTLFLDELGELPLTLQPKLLRVLESQTLRRVGGGEDIRVGVRVVAATHRNLREEVAKGAFREDLYFRLYVVPVVVPPLRERATDIELLSRHFLSQAKGSRAARYSDGALKKLCQHSWPGNVRELKNVILRSLVFSAGEEIASDEIQLGEGSYGTQAGAINLVEVEKSKIVEALEKTGGNKTKAAELLGIAKSTLFKKLKEYEIPF